MRIVLIIAAVCCLGVMASDDSIAMESEVRYHKVKRHNPEDEIEIDRYHTPRPERKVVQVKHEKGRKTLVHREREARAQEESWIPYHKQEVKGPVYELPQGFNIDGKYFEEPQHRYHHQEEEQTRGHVPYVAVQKPHKEEGENLKVESSQHSGLASGSYLNHIKEQMNEGKLLGYSSFVEHFSENDDAEELKTAMREGSLDDIKKLVPKSVVSFQMYHGGEEQKVYKTEPIAERKPEPSWNQLNDWHQPSPTAWTPPQTHYVKSEPIKSFVIPERKKKIRKHPERVERYRPVYHYTPEESREEIQTTTAPEPSKITSNEVYDKESYAQIIPSISYELPSQTYKGNVDYEVASSEISREQDRQESQSNFNKYAYDSKQSAWMPVSDRPTASGAASEQHKVISTPKPPETSKLYFEHLKNAKVNSKETSKFSQLPKIGQVVDVSHTQENTRYLKRPLRVHPTPQPFSKKPTQSNEDYNHRYAQIPTTTPAGIRIVTPQPTRYWSRPDPTNYKPQTRFSTPIKLEKILNKQAETHAPTDKPAKDGNGNIFLTKEFQSEISEFFNGGKSDLEWVPSTQVRYDARAPSPTAYHAENAKPQPKPKKYRIYRSGEHSQGVPGSKSVVFLGPEGQPSPGSFSVGASYQIDKNRRSGE